MSFIDNADPLIYIYKPNQIFRKEIPSDEGLVSDILLDGKKVGRIDILPPEEYGSMYDTQKLECIGAMIGLWINDTTGEYYKQIREGKIFSGIKVRAYVNSIVEATILMEDNND